MPRATCAVVFLTTLLALLPSPARAADSSSSPNDFLAAWRQAADPAADARAIWKQFAEAHANEELGQLARLLVVTAHLRANDLPAAQAALPVDFNFTPANPPNPSAAELRKQLPAAAKALAARIKLLQLAQKLRAYFGKHVEYPAALHDLVPAKLATEADLVDPFGQPWTYEATANSLDPKLPRQKYTLSCATLKLERRDAAAGLASITDAPKQVALSSVEPAEARAFLKGRRADGAMGPTVRIPVGGEIEDLTLWCVHDNFIILGSQKLPRVLVKE
ncbi:MAG: hypothetical protein NTW19_02400 [Planctomycetota bacterium]|nr:hypothetical protein [Planctomycetota bacterium]